MLTILPPGFVQRIGSAFPQIFFFPPTCPVLFTGKGGSHDCARLVQGKCGQRLSNFNNGLIDPFSQNQTIKAVTQGL
jgi:hypothetical protein